MFVRQPQFRNSNADVQIFYGDATSTTDYRFKKSWNKPPGVSHVYMMLIGPGGNDDGAGTGGGSGAVTVWYGAAQNVPDQLEINSGGLGRQYSATVSYRTTSSTAITLLTASAATSSSGGAAMAANFFTASGFFQSVAGVGGSSASVSGVTTTFLTSGGGTGSSSYDVTSQYGYNNSGGTNSNRNGFFMLQPIIVGVGATGTGRPGIGCGMGGTNGTSFGGQGMVLIASW